MNTKSPGQTAELAFLGCLSKGIKTEDTLQTWEIVAQEVLQTHAPKLTAQDVERARLHWLDVGGSLNQVTADYLNSTPKAPAQEQEWDIFEPRATLIENGDEQESIFMNNVSWIKLPQWTWGLVNQIKLRRPRQPQQAYTCHHPMGCAKPEACEQAGGCVEKQPQQAGKESKPKDENDLSEWTTHCLLISKEGEAKLAELYKDAPRITRSDMLALEARAKEINAEEAADQSPKGGDGATPESDNEGRISGLCSVDFARQLERQRDTARAELAKVKGELEESKKKSSILLGVGEHVRLESEVHTLKSQLEKIKNIVLQ